MEAKQEQKKLTYEELSAKFGELFASYQKATAYIQKLEGALNDDSFNKTSFFISMLFKVMEHPEMYDTDFVEWSKDNVQSCMKTFAEIFQREELEDKKEENPEK